MGKELYAERTDYYRLGAGHTEGRFFVLTINSDNGKPGEGCLFSPMTGEPQHFDGIAEAMLLMDRIMDRLAGERDEGQLRQFNQDRAKNKHTAGDTGCDKDRTSGWTGWNAQAFLNRGKMSESFCVQVYYMENMSWQGEILWSRMGQKQYFRSVLELMALIDSAFSVDTLSVKYQGKCENLAENK